MVGVEVAQDEGIILGLEEWVESRGETRRTGGRRRDVDIEDVYFVFVDESCDGEVFSGDIVGEQVVRR